MAAIDDPPYVALQPESVVFHLPNQLKFFAKEDATTDTITDDYEYYRRMCAVELTRWTSFCIRDSMNHEIFCLGGSDDFFASPKWSKTLNGLELCDILDDMCREMRAKLTAKLDLAGKRAENAFVPTLERYLAKLGMPAEENAVVRFVLAFQTGPFSHSPNSEKVMRPHQAQMYQRYQHRQPTTYLPIIQLADVFSEFPLMKLMGLFAQSSKWVTERMLTATTDPGENAATANDALKLVIMGLPVTSTQYHSLESTVMQACLAENPAFKETDAGKAHASNLKVQSELEAAGGDATRGNKFREALMQRDRSKKDSVFDVLTAMKEESWEGGQESEGEGEHPVAMEGRQASAQNMMKRAPSAMLDDVEEEVVDETDDAKMKLPYKTDLEYLEDQFQILAKEKKMIKLKTKLEDALEGAQDGPPADDEDPYAYNRKTVYKGGEDIKIQAEIRMMQTKLKIANEKARSRLLATSSAGKWYPRLEILMEALGMIKFEKLVVLQLVKAIIDPDKNNDRYCYNSESSAISNFLDKFCATLEERMACRSSFYKSSTLIKEGIIFVTESDFMKDLSQMEVDLDRRMLDFIIGMDTEFSEIVDGSHLYDPKIALSDVVLPEADKKRIVDIVENFEKVKHKRTEYEMEARYQYGFGQVLLFYGASGTGKTMLANAIATAMKRKVLLINFPSLGQNSAGQIIKFLFREAKINKALIFFDECESLFMDRDKGAYHVNTVLTELEKFDGLCIMATNRPCDLDDAMHRRINLAIEFKKPDHILRERIWRTLHPPKLPLDDDVDFAHLAMKYELTGGFIKNAWLGGLALMVARKGDKVSLADLTKSSDEQIVGRLSMSDFDRKVTPTVGLSAVVASKEIKESLSNIVQFSKAQSVLFGQWGFGKQHKSTRGLTVLFTGPPGTGKTMAAEAIGFDLGRPLKVVNVSELMSKWVGETGKNIESVFESAKREDAVLVFDEAEGLFGARGEGSTSCDRHDTVNVGLLLQYVENFAGVCVVITNMKEKIDGAFFRRFRFVLNFEKPDRTLRAQLWKTVVPAECPLAKDVNFESLAEKFETTGGQIKSILLRAATRAALRPDTADRVVAMSDLERSCKEELDKDSVGSSTAHLSMFM